MKILLPLLLLSGCTLPYGTFYHAGDRLDCPKALLESVDKKLEELCPKQSPQSLPS